MCLRDRAGGCRQFRCSSRGCLSLFVALPFVLSFALSVVLQTLGNSEQKVTKPVALPVALSFMLSSSRVGAPMAGFPGSGSRRFAQGRRDDHPLSVARMNPIQRFV